MKAAVSRVAFPPFVTQPLHLSALQRSSHYSPLGERASADDQVLLHLLGGFTGTSRMTCATAPRGRGTLLNAPGAHPLPLSGATRSRPRTWGGTGRRVERQVVCSILGCSTTPLLPLRGVPVLPPRESTGRALLAFPRGDGANMRLGDEVLCKFLYQSTRRRPTLPLQPPGRLSLRRRSQLPLLRNSLRRSVRQPHQPRKGSGRITRCLMVWLFAFPCRSIPFPSGGGPLPGTPVPHHGTYRASVSGRLLCCATIYILTVRSCGVGRPPRAPTDGLAVTPLPKRVRGGRDGM